MDKPSLRYIVENGNFTICPLLQAEQFVRHCEERGIEVTIRHLERYEKLGIFMPTARVRYPKVRTKIVPSEGGKGYTELGNLEEGEEWEGEVKEWYAHLYWLGDSAREWMTERLLWEPNAEGFKPWSTFKDEQGEKIVESLYSIFQTFPLYSLMRSTALPRLGLDQVVLFSEEERQSWVGRWAEHAPKIISIYADGDSALDKMAALCQALSTRYYPYTRSDGVMIPVPISEFGFDWHKYRRHWDARKVLDDLGLEVEEVARFVELAAGEAESIDPLARWRDLTRFFRPDKRAKLKDEALLAQTGYAMELMLNLFHRDLTGREIYLFDRSPEDIESLYGKGVTQDDLRYLELLSNEYNVNPRPRLILAVEGKGEFEQFPRLAEEFFGMKLSKLRVGMINLSGVEGFTGKKKYDPYGALEKLIDYYHYMQTIVFVILDDEARVSVIKQRLLQARSKFRPNRTVTKDEYIRLWKKNIEFDNFTHDEIARAMTEVSGGAYVFNEGEIADCESRFGREGDTLSKLYYAKLNYDLVKPALLRILFGYAIATPKMELNNKKPMRPIIEVINNVIELALRNHPPSYLDAWEETQNSDWLGVPLPDDPS